MDHRRAISRYYAAYRERDRAALESLLAPDVHFRSAFGEYRHRDAMLDDIWPHVGQVWATNLRVFGDGPDFVVLYEHADPSGPVHPPVTMAEYVRFAGDRIVEIEVFSGRGRDRPA
jgi:hypothetical protein